MATRDVPIAAPDVPGSAAVVDVARSRAAADKRSLVAKAPSPASAIVNTAEPAPASSVGFPTDANNRASVTTLREERALVDGALIAMSSGDRKRAAELLDAHASRFPNGLLRLERERARSKLDTEAR
jgi:hypothetical protein